jgi:2-hydroxycyclohexanecarboxyl-CoA dehydrogenase
LLRLPKKESRFLKENNIHCGGLGINKLKEHKRGANAMDLGLYDKVALVTGSGQGVGREIAKTLGSEGAFVIVNDVFEKKALSVADEINSLGGKAIGFKADITNPSEVNAMVIHAQKNAGPVDILINNAGVPVSIRSGEVPKHMFAESRDTDWKMYVDLNIYGWLNCTHAVLKNMVERRQGKILSVISEAGRVGEVGDMVYSGTKAGVLGFTKALAKETGKHCINVNCIALGATAHEAMILLNPDATPESDDVLKKLLKSYPIGKGLGRIGRPSDAAAAVAFLVSEKASFITGQCLSVSGGYSMIG